MSVGVLAALYSSGAPARACLISHSSTCIARCFGWTIPIISVFIRRQFLEASCRDYDPFETTFFPATIASSAFLISSVEVSPASSFLFSYFTLAMLSARPW
jgi:hypothetical protein